MTFTSEADALAKTAARHRRRDLFRWRAALHLPAASLGSTACPGLFMAHLKQKAGLPADYWSPGVQLERYAVRKWKEEQL